MLLVHFGRWDAIDKLPKPDDSLKATMAIWHFARGIAFATRGEVKRAKDERDALVEAGKAVPAEAVSAAGLNPASKTVAIAGDVLQARIAAAQQDKQAAIRLLRQAVEKEDSLAFEEPPSWFLPVRELLGGALLRAGYYAAAEQVFRADLGKNRFNGRSLFGLIESIKAQKGASAAGTVNQQFRTAWKNADNKLTIRDLWQ